MIDWEQVSDVAKIGAMVGAFLFAALRGRGWIKKKSAEDGAAIAEDGARVDMLKRALDEADRQRERADMAFDQRNEAVQELGALRAKIESLEQHRVDCDRRIAELEKQIQVLRTIVERRGQSRENSQ